jgi:flagellar hook-length control protein FliK
MMQTAIVQVSPPPPSGTNSLSGSSSSSFTPHLENSIAEKAENRRSSPQDESGEVDFPAENSPDEIAESSPFMPPLPQSDPQHLSQTADESVALSLPAKQNSPLNCKELSTDSRSFTVTDESSLSQLSTAKENLPFKINIALTDSRSNTIQPAPLIENDAMLKQLEEIIASGRETGIVSIQGTAGNSSALASNLNPAVQGDIFPVQIQQLQRYSDDHGGNLPTIRQNALAHYLHAKVSSSDRTETGSNPSPGDQQSSTDNQQIPVPSQSGTLLSTSESNGFQQFSVLMNSTNTIHLQNSPTGVILPSGMVAYEENVMQQVTGHFHSLWRKDGDRLTLKLHPAELGELKIDLTVKEGSIKANVLAQSQYIQDIVERNLPRLKNSLAERGYTVEEILVTAQSDTVADFNPFEQHLSGRRDSMPPGSEPGRSQEFNVVLDDVIEETPSSATGVNIKV